ncbi:hypothetical protein NHH03_26090 [Stieleria sp. TO1_6]|uniref:hypothetical protein n=1 Tax=Stieleria tagensis TaxID=2956795 RepID=UPI00209AEBE3|nr:hypothetical protein [Stieleria tagensis]MCO8125235.1 hypothetical protein [Stieleria tagensis]
MQTRCGKIAIDSVETFAYRGSVYNLEVHTEHVYEIGELGVLVHNGTESCALGKALANGDLAKKSRITKQGYQAAHIVSNPGWGSRKPQKAIDAIGRAHKTLDKAGID